MAQDPEEEPRGGGELNTSHDLDMVTIYESNTIESETEAEVIRGLLTSNGIPATVVSGTPYPPLGHFIQVPRNRLEEARSLIAEARATGPEGAAEAEASSEENH
jgi:hypothetical protein